jgi:hypothetical protein
MAAGGQGVLRRLLAVFEIKTDTTGLDKGKDKARDFMKEMKKVAEAFTGGMIAKGVANFVRDTVDEMMGIRKGAQELKITTDEMQQLQSAARATGMDVKWLHFTLERLEVNVERAGHGAKRQAEAMKLLGISAKHANGSVKSAKELFLDFASGFEKVKNQNTQARAVWDMMGRGAHRLLPLLRMGRARIEELMQATEEYGKYEEKNIEQAAEYTVVLEHLHLVWVGLKGFIMSQWLPILQRQTEWLIKAGQWFFKMSKNSLIAAAALRVLTVAMAWFTLRTMAAYPVATLLMAVLAGLVLVLDDLMAWAQGGQSAFGDAIDALFGKGASTALLETALATWKQIEQVMKDVKWAYDEITGKGHKPDEAGPQERTFHASDKDYAGAAADELPWPFNRAVQFDVWNKTTPLKDKPQDIAAEFFGQPQWAHDYGVSGGAPAGGTTVTIGEIKVVAPDGTDGKAHGKAVADEVRAQINTHTKAAAASLRRERQAR